MSKTDKTHDLYCQKLKKIGDELEFHAIIGSKGKMFHMGKPDCVWYYECEGKEPLLKIAKGERIKCNCNSCKEVNQYLPFLAFEVCNSEDEKGLRGSLMALQLTNATASIIVLTGKSEREYKKYMGKLLGRYSYMRTRIWKKEYVDDLYKRLVG
jgi:hypothetical protein